MIRKTVIVDADCAKASPLVALLRSLSYDNQVIFISNKSGALHYEEWRNWLDDHGIPYDELHARLQGDERPTPAFKQGVLSYLKERGHSILLAIDNDADSVAAWRANGVHCLQTAVN